MKIDLQGKISLINSLIAHTSCVKGVSITKLDNNYEVKSTGYDQRLKSFIVSPSGNI